MGVQRMAKPDNWESLLFYEKIRLYAGTLTEEHARYTDKLTAKELAKSQCPEIEIPKVVRVLSDHKDLRSSDINPDHILKSAHASKWNNDFKDNPNLGEINNKLLAWNKKYKEGSFEKHYSFIEPRFFIEEKIQDRLLGKTGKAIAYMIRCIDGVPISIGAARGARQTSYDLQWNKISHCPITGLNVTIEKPHDLGNILDYASKLAQPFEFVRIDLYLSPDKIYFSEYTFTPAGGYVSFTGNVALEKQLGALWR